MNVALIQRAQHDVHDADGHKQQQAEISHRFLEHLGRALEGDGHRRRQHLAGDLPDALDGCAERHALP